MKGTKSYRHLTNPLEKQLHDSFINHFSPLDMERLVFGTIGTGTPNDRLSERECEITINTIQWLGSPVGQAFLRDNGFQQPNLSMADIEQIKAKERCKTLNEIEEQIGRKKSTHSIVLKVAKFVDKELDAVYKLIGHK